MQIHYVDKVYSDKTKSTVSLSLPMYRWTILKTAGHCVWLEASSIFLLWIFKKKITNEKGACQGKFVMT